MEIKVGDILRVKGEIIEEIKKGGRIRYDGTIIYEGMASALLKNKDKIEVTLVDRNDKGWIMFEGGKSFGYRVDFFESCNDVINSEEF